MKKYIVLLIVLFTCGVLCAENIEVPSKSFPSYVPAGTFGTLTVEGGLTVGGDAEIITFTPSLDKIYMLSNSLMCIEGEGGDNNTEVCFDLDYGATGLQGPMITTQTGSEGIFFGSRQSQATASPRFDFIDTDGGWAKIAAGSGNFSFMSDQGSDTASSNLTLGIDGDVWLNLQGATNQGKGVTIAADAENLIEYGDPSALTVGSKVWCTTRIAYVAADGACPDYDLVGLGAVSGTKVSQNDNSTMCVYCDTWNAP